MLMGAGRGTPAGWQSWGTGDRPYARGACGGRYRTITLRLRTHRARPSGEPAFARGASLGHQLVKAFTSSDRL